MRVRIGPYKYWGWYHRWISHLGFTKLANWLHGDRNIKIKIDYYDSWSADHTLSLIAIPLLKQLKATKHGIPGDLCGEVDENGHCDTVEGEKRWDMIISKMIWAHEQVVNDDADVHDLFYIDVPGELKFGEKNEMNCRQIYFDPPGKMNMDAYLAYHDRIDEGLKLFGEYYRDLWD